MSGAPAVSGDLAEGVSFEQIVAAIRRRGFAEMADDIERMNAQVDLDPEQQPICLKSLRRTALFLLDDKRMLYSLMSLTPHGHVWLEWRFSGGDFLAMEFLPTDLIHFVAMDRNKAVLDAKPGVASPQEAKELVRSFSV